MKTRYSTVFRVGLVAGSQVPSENCRRPICDGFEQSQTTDLKACVVERRVMNVINSIISSGRNKKGTYIKKQHIVGVLCVNRKTIKFKKR